MTFDRVLPAEQMTETDLLRGAVLEALARIDALDMQLRIERGLADAEGVDAVLRSTPAARALEDALTTAWADYVARRDAFRASQTHH